MSTIRKSGCDIYEDKIPVSDELMSSCEEFNLNSTTVALKWRRRL